MQIITRAEARALGSKRYFTGKPCKNGHVAERLEINGSCCNCAAIRRRIEYHKNIEAERTKQKTRRDSDPAYGAKKRARRIAREPGYEGRSNIWKAANEARRAAAERGDSQYTTGRPCALGHVSPRYTKGGKCVECSRISCRDRYEAHAQQSPSILEFRRTAKERAAMARRKRETYAQEVGAWRKAHEARQGALRNGDKTYVGSKCPEGHDGLRYTKHGTCVKCAALRAASDAKKSYDVEYGRRNRERIRARHREYDERTKAGRVAFAKKWVAENREKVRAIKKTYKARRRAQEEGGDSTSSIHKWEMSAPKVCYWCSIKCPKKYHVDHYVPLSKGGRHVVSNLVIACPRCNLKKSAKDPYEFAASVGRLF